MNGERSIAGVPGGHAGRGGAHRAPEGCGGEEPPRKDVVKARRGHWSGRASKARGEVWGLAGKT